MNIKNLASQLLLASTLLVSSASFATVLTGNLNVDNNFQAYISTDNSVAGTALTSGTDWTVTDTLITTLDAGQDYFLHIAAQDVGGIAGFLGDFFLDVEDHVFANGLEFITTNADDWLVSTSGWNNYVGATGIALNGASPWGYQSAVDANAVWIWSADEYADNSVFFSLAITATTSPTQTNAVPEPSIIALLGFGLLGLSFMSRRKVK